MRRVAVIGCGLVGRAWAIDFARAGHPVAMWDPDGATLGSAVPLVAQSLRDLERHELLGGSRTDEVLARIVCAPDLAAAVAGADYVQESAPEKIEVKAALFGDLDALADRETILASSTSALLPSSFTQGLAGRERCLVSHPINPPYLVRAVEIVPAPWTAPDAVERTRALLAAAGHELIVLRREIDGFIMNRLQGAVLHEAFRLVAEGYCCAEDIDIGMREGLAPRWSVLGPFETIDLNAPGGIRDYVARFTGMYGHMRPGDHVPADWTGPVLDVVEADLRTRTAMHELPGRQAWRDTRLMALASLRNKSDEGR